jgi:hypothetical protein
MTSYRKITYDLCFLTQFSNIKKVTLIRLLAIILFTLGLTFSNSMLALLAILYFPIISYFLLLDDPLKNEIMILWVFFLVDFQFNFLR